MSHRSIFDRLQLAGSAKHLALVRIIFGIHVLSVLLSPVIITIRQYVDPAAVAIGTETIFPLFVENILNTHIVLIQSLGIMAALLTIIGFLTKYFMPLLFLCFLVTQNYYYRHCQFHDDWLYFNFYLLTLSFSRCSDAWAVDALFSKPSKENMDLKNYRWPIELMILWFVGLYVAAGVAKLFPLQKGMIWLTGVAVREFVQFFALDSPIYWTLGHSLFNYDLLWPFSLIAIVTVFTEFAVIGLLFTHHYRMILLPAIVSMHVGIYCFGIPGFVQIALISMVLFIPDRWFTAGAKPIN